jgi:membrane protein DedA with SNARE-associated domain/uncharacterized tellurite resistance protein B-like protein
MISLATLLENAFPPVPSDVIVALGGFSARGGGISPLTVFAVAWIGSMAGAIATYTLARRYGRSWFQGWLGRRLVRPESIAALEKGYLRFGLVGIVLGRLLPGFRGLVPPFAGLVGLSAVQTFVPIALASALWYAGVTALGWTLGSQWEAIVGTLDKVNRSLALAAAVLAIAGLWAIVRHWRSRRRDPIWEAVHRAFQHSAGQQAQAHENEAVAAAAAFLLQLAESDGELPESDLAVIRSALGSAETPAAPSGRQGLLPQGTDETAAFAGRIASRYDHRSRLDLLRRLKAVAERDGALGPHEERLLRRSADLLGVSADEWPEISTPDVR